MGDVGRADVGIRPVRPTTAETRSSTGQPPEPLLMSRAYGTWCPKKSQSPLPSLARNSGNSQLITRPTIDHSTTSLNGTPHISDRWYSAHQILD